MPVPVIAYYVLTGLGGYLLAQGDLVRWLAGSDDEWSDAEVFNARMRQIHTGILQLNELFAKCKVLHTPDKAAELTSWKTFVTLWAQYYKEVGSKYFDPNENQIVESKNFATNLAKWIDVYSHLCGPVPTGLKQPETVSQKPASSWGTWLLWAVAIGTGGYVLSSFLKSKSRSLLP
jgi:hypothetical protein